MKITETSVKHPITAFMVFIAIALIGFMSLSRLGLELFPDITFPTILVYSVYPGVGPEEVESGLTKPMETALSSLSGVKELSSTSSEGISMVIVNFDWGTNMDSIVTDAREKIATIEDSLPEGVQRPVILKFNPEQLPSIVFNISTRTEGIDIRKMVEDEIQPELEKIRGVAEVDVYGGSKVAVTCKLHLDAIAKLDISIMQILQIFQGENINLPGGSISLKNKTIVLRTIGEFQYIKDIGDVLVGYRNQVPVYLRNIADIDIGYLPQDQFVRTEGLRGVSVSVKKQTGHNTVKVNDEIKRKLNILKKKLPPSMNLVITSDQSTSIVDSIGGVQDAAVQGGLLAIFILLFFLRNIRSTLIISIAIPVSIIATFTLMDFGGITINILSLMGITLGIGMFVDNSIVVLESNYRKQLSGLSPVESAIQGTNEVAKAITASTLTTVAVFLPLIFVEGVAGMLFRDLAYTISFALVVSLAMALTLMPVLCAKFLKVDLGHKVSGDSEELSLADVEIHTGNKFIDGIAKKIQNLLQKLDAGYERLLNWALKHSLAVIITAVILLVVSVSSILLMGMEFLPEADEGNFVIDIETRIGTPYAKTEEKIIQAEQIVMREVGKDLASISSRVGSGGGLMGGGTGSHLGNIRVNLTLKDNRERSIWKIVNQVSAALKNELLDTRIKLQIQGMSSMAASASGSSAALSVMLYGDNLVDSYNYAKRIATVMEKVPGTRDVEINYTSGKPELQFRVKRKEAVSLGLSPYAIAATIRTAYKGTEVSRFNDGDNDYDIILLLTDEDRNNLARISNLYFINQQGTKIPIENVVEIVDAEGPLSINRKHRTRQITITGSLSGEVALNRVGEDIEKGIKALGRPPSGITIDFGGASTDMNESFRDLSLALLLAVALVYMVMASQFESLLHPFIVMFSVPFAIVGLVLALLVTNTTFSIIAFIGAILLVGIVVNNAIVLIDYMNLLYRNGVPLREAIIRGGKTRLKPILMTTFTTIVGLIPMSLGFGTGAELRYPIGRAVVGGLSTSTLVTLILIPVIYWLIEKKLKQRKERSENL